MCAQYLVDWDWVFVFFLPIFISLDSHAMSYSENGKSRKTLLRDWNQLWFTSLQHTPHPSSPPPSHKHQIRKGRGPHRLQSSDERQRPMVFKRDVGSIQ